MAGLSDYAVQKNSVVMLVLRMRGGGPCVPEVERMGIAAGGMITQKIYEDDHSPLIYDDENPYRLYIQTIYTATWEDLTGVLCQMTPITPARSVQGFRYPWFDLYDERLPTVHHNGAFSTVRSIKRLDNTAPPSYHGIDPESPPNTKQFRRYMFLDRVTIPVVRHAWASPCWQT
ncbi:hypothetical protein C8R47DRAFT_733079 [Mycena vitilis]|nr:hypothetical protein C8R47DRAFT_733079 [Mycena vitilis]